MRSFLLALFAVVSFQVQAQVSPLLTLRSIQAEPGGPALLSFADRGTGATNYVVQFSPAMGSGWTNLLNVIVVDLGAGNYQAAVNRPESPAGFYRVRGLGAAGIIVTAGFSLTTQEAEEGATAIATLVFSSPFFGTVRYRVQGTAPSGDYLNLTGEVMVDGTTATIPIQLTDNESIGPLKYLTLTLEPGSGYAFGSTSRSTINILENDAEWQGSLITAEANLGFVLRIQQSNQVYRASLKSDRFGFFPTEASPASITLNDALFASTAQDIPMPAEATLLNAPMNLTLSLMARNGVTNQFVTPTQIRGEASLVITVPSAPHLGTTNKGTFLLTKPPVGPATNEVQLVTIP